MLSILLIVPIIASIIVALINSPEQGYVNNVSRIKQVALGATLLNFIISIIV